MTRYFCILLYALFVLLVPVDKAVAWDGTVVKVIDGDSIKVQRDGALVEIRLYGIDTPEYRQPYSNKAKQFTKRLAYRKTVAVEEMDIDHYGRVVAVITVGDMLVNRELVREGLAWYYPKYCRKQPLCRELKKLEQQARRKRVGLWRDTSPVSPWNWKRQKRVSGSVGGSVWYERFLHWL